VDGWSGHVPALDGVRGLAIALVLLCHVVWDFTPPAYVERGLVEVARVGWIGVDLFFVLSGFLITGILLDAKGAPNYFRNFYVRRTLRIFPLYYVILIGVFVVAPLVAGARDEQWFTSIVDQQGWFWSYTSNVLLAITGQWDQVGVLGHFWSLAVEEQFYLIWPAVVLLLSPRQLRKACGVILVAALGLRVIIALGPSPGLGAFTLMPARADTLAIGAWLAAALRTGVRLDTIRRYAPWVLGLAFIAVAVLFVRYRRLSEADFLTMTLGFSSLGLGFGALLTLGLDVPQRSTPLGRFFRSRSLRVLGKYSYAMYCFHPLIQEALGAGGIHGGNLPIVGGSVLPSLLAYGALVLVLTFGVSYATWNLLEKHFLRLKDRFATVRVPVRRGKEDLQPTPARTAEPSALAAQSK
jgi:peptidoglycan/LPS O-acetylase OafA/YrhL